MGSAWWQCAACLRAQEEDIFELQLNHCNLYDVPPDVFIYERTLEKLYLEANRIKDLPRPLFQCHELRELSLSDNEISTLPPAIASLINLEYLNLSKNNIKELPDSIKECKSLCSIDISVNPFERFPDAITHIVGLRELYINDAYIEYLPANFGRLSALRKLELRENNMMTLPKSMSRLVNLQRLDIGNNDFKELPEVVGDLINLTELWIDGNDIRRIPTNIEQLHRLNHFDCTMNAVHALPPEVQGWRDISIMNLSSNELYELPDTLCFLRTIVILKIDDNQLNALPNDIGQMSSLEELIVTKNFLEYLPSSIGLLRKLHCLNADNNYLRCLPPEIGSCTALSLLSLQSNNLTRVPPELGHLSSLRVFNLVNNCIKFLPVSMLNLTNLKALWLSDNQSQPLVPLQQEFNNEEDMMVLSCFMLPQKPRQDLEQMSHVAGPISSSIIGTGRRICFAAEVESELPKQLQRAPTPYPKELRNLARHARNLHHQSIHEQKTQVEEDTIIKEAKIAKPIGNLEGVPKGGSCIPNNYYSEMTSSPVTADSPIDFKPNTPTDLGTNNSNSEESSDEATKTVLAKKKNPDIREARYIRNTTSDYVIKVPTVTDYVNSSWKPDEYTRANTAMIVESEKLTEPYRNGLNVSDAMSSDRTSLQGSRIGQVPPIPPPYHIAAAFSKKAAFFQHLNNPSHVSTQPTPSPQLITDIPSTEEILNESRKEIYREDSEPEIERWNVEAQDGFMSTSRNEHYERCGEENSANKDVFDTLLEPDVLSETTTDADQTFGVDRLHKPSKIPVLRTKPSENVPCNSEFLKKMPYYSPNSPEHLHIMNGSNIPTSPITGKKYRSPLSVQTHKPADRAREELLSRATADSGKTNASNYVNSGLTANALLAKENVDPDTKDNTCETATSFATADVKSPSNSGRSTPMSLDVYAGKSTHGLPNTNVCKVQDVNTTLTSDRKQQPLKWMFGPHRNASVLPVQLRKNPGLGFSIAGGVAGAETGIIVTKVNPEGPARGTLRPGDKILEVDGIDFTKSDHDNAVAVLRATGAVVSMMISRYQ